MKAANRISFEVAEEYFFFDPFSAKIFWKKPTYRKGKSGREAGHINDSGYRIIKIFGERYRASHIIWLLITGNWPSCEVDHKNRDRSDNHWENLRLATSSQNRANQTIRSDNTSGYRGVSWHEGAKKWTVSVGNRYYGRLNDVKEAARHYDKIAIEVFGEFANLNFPEC